MGKKFQKNKMLIITLAAAGAVALLLLVYVVIVVLQWSEFSDRTKAAQSKVAALNSSTPAPGAENESRIEEDIVFYEEKGKGLVDNFKTPLRPAVDAFIAALKEPIIGEDDEDKDLYKVPGTGEEDENGNMIPLKIAKLTYSSFCTFILSRFEKYCESNNITEEKDKYSLSTLSRFNGYCKKLFPAGSWDKALDKFVEAASPLTYEVIDDANRLAILLTACELPEDKFGPRRVDASINRLQDQVDRMVEGKIMKIADFDGSPNRGFFAENSLVFIGGGSKNYTGSSNDSSRSEAGSQWKSGDYPAVFFHWDVFGDISKRLFDSGVLSLQKVILRTKSGDGEDGSDSKSKIDLKNSFEEDGNYRIYHYTLVFTCSMNNLRKVMENFDTAWRGDEKGFGKRMYVVRALALYAVDDGADRVINPIMKKGDQANNNSQDDADAAAQRRRRRRRANSGEAVQKEESKAETVEFKPLYMVSEEEAQMRYYEVLWRIEEEKKGTSHDEIRKHKELDAEKRKAEYEKFAKKQPPAKRYGYATVLVGEHNDECEVYLDIDYVVLKQNQ